MELFLQIKNLNDALRKRGNSHLESLGLTITQHFVLVYLNENIGYGNSVPLKSLEKRFKVAQATMAGIIQRLETKGYVYCFNKPEDKRVKYVEISDKGKTFCESSKEFVKQSEKKTRDLFTDEEYQHLQEYLERIYEFVSKEDIQ